VSRSLLDDADFGVVDTGIELEDLTRGEEAGSGGNKAETGREVRRKEKWNLKLKDLINREEMKFSHSIQFNAVPDWSSNYISYSNLKKLCVYSPSPGFFAEHLLTLYLAFTRSRSKSTLKRVLMARIRKDPRCLRVSCPMRIQPSSACLILSLIGSAPSTG
jgi:SPX domain